jgi:DsbC/DsbD-like thiol-disulfide interchange protein
VPKATPAGSFTVANSMWMASAALAAGVSLCTLPASAQKGTGLDAFVPRKSGSELVKLSLIRAKGVLGLHFDIEPGWHIYWKNPGDTGAPPTWKISGVRTGEVMWPAPTRHESNDILDYVYEGSVTILFATDPLAAGTLSMEVDWLVCKDVCLAGSGHAETVMVPYLNEDNGIVPLPDERLVAAHKRIPVPPAEAGVDVQAAFKGGRLDIRVPGAKRLVFFPDASPEMVAPKDALHEAVSDSDSLSMQYTAEAASAAAITGVLEVHRADGTEAFCQVSVPGPAARAASTPEGSR